MEANYIEDFGTSLLQRDTSCFRYHSEDEHKQPLSWWHPFILFLAKKLFSLL
jgi:hypothetical protein